MNRRHFVFGGMAIFAAPNIARAQRKPAVIGLLWNDSVKPSPFAKILLDALQQKGWVVERDFRFVDRVTLEGYGGYAEAIDDLIRAKVDVIVTSGATATKAAAKATREIPIVMRIGADPVASGFAASLARPGGNITGITTLNVGANAKRIQLLKELLPRLSRVGILLVPEAAAFAANVRDSEAAAQELQLELRVGEVRSLEQIDAVLADLKKAGVGAVYVPGSTMLAAHGERVVTALTRHRMPAVYANDQFADAGGVPFRTRST
jgi:putative tryptophan/tyrosine transport system substrate-binding protein